MLTVDLIVALGLSVMFIFAIASMINISSEIFERSKKRKISLDEFVMKSDFDSSYPYGNERILETARIPSSSIEFKKVRGDLLRPEDRSSPLCSPVFTRAKSIRPIMLPVDPLLPLTDIQVRNGVAYVSADSAYYEDDDFFVFDIGGVSAKTVSSINSGPGIASFKIVGNKIFSAARSSAYQLHIFELGPGRTLSLSSRFSLPLPPSTTPPYGSAIAAKWPLVILGTEKWNSRELIFFNMSDLSSPQIIGVSELGSKVNHIDIDGDGAYVSASGMGQLFYFDFGDTSNITQVESFEPSGWQRQVGITTNYFEDEMYFGRNSGGFNVASDHELFFWPRKGSLLGSYQSLDIGGGVYGVLSSKTHLALATRMVDKELLIVKKPIDSKNFDDAQVIPLPVAPETMTCDNNHLYVLAKTAPYIYEVSLE